MNILISTCLLGKACRYDGRSKTYTAVTALQKGRTSALSPSVPKKPAASVRLARRRSDGTTRS